MLIPLLLLTISVMEDRRKPKHDIDTQTGQKEKEKHTGRHIETHREVWIFVVKLSRCPTFTVVCLFSLISHVSLNAYIMPILFIYLFYLKNEKWIPRFLEENCVI